MVELTNLEEKILLFIDKHTWDENKFKTTNIITGRYKTSKTARIKIRWMNIRWREGYPQIKKKRFTDSDIDFNKALNTLKTQKLITSRTKCQQFAGLTCTELGHNLSIRLDFNTV